MSRAVATRAWLPSPPAALWDALCFYEAVTGPVPALLRVALPVPWRVVGDPRTPGAVTRCEYRDGEHLVKRSTRIEPGRLLEFEVLACSERLSRQLRVLGGTIALEPDASDRPGPLGTWVRMETRYAPRGPLFALRRPFAEAIIRALHRRVRDEMRTRAGLPVEKDECLTPR